MPIKSDNRIRTFFSERFGKDKDTDAETPTTTATPGSTPTSASSAPTTPSTTSTSPEKPSLLEKTESAFDDYKAVHPVASSGIEKTSLYGRDIINLSSDIRRLASEFVARNNGTPARINSFIPKIGPSGMLPRLRDIDEMSEAEREIKSASATASLAAKGFWLGLNKQEKYTNNADAMATNQSVLGGLGLLALPENSNSSTASNAAVEWFMEPVDKMFVSLGITNAAKFSAQLAQTDISNSAKIAVAVGNSAANTGLLLALAEPTQMVAEMSANQGEIAAEDPVASMTADYLNGVDTDYDAQAAALNQRRIGFDAFTTISYYLGERSKSIFTRGMTATNMSRNIALMEIESADASSDKANLLLAGASSLAQIGLNETARLIKANQFDEQSTEQNNPYKQSSLVVTNIASSAAGFSGAVLINSIDHEAATPTVFATATQINNAIFTPKIHHALGQHDLSKAGGTNMLSFTGLDGAASAGVNSVAGFGQMRLFEYGQETGSMEAKLPLLLGAAAVTGQYVGYALIARPSDPQAVKGHQGEIYKNDLKDVAHLAWIPAASWLGGLAAAKIYSKKHGKLSDATVKKDKAVSLGDSGVQFDLAQWRSDRKNRTDLG